MPTIEICLERELPVPAAKVWAFLGEGFGDWAKWVNALETTNLDGPISKGSVRTCKLKSLGPVAGIVVEEVLTYDPATFVVEYFVHSGVPGFMNRVTNRWRVVPMGQDKCKLTSNSAFKIAWYMTPMYYPLKWQLSDGLQKFQDDIEEESKKTLLTTAMTFPTPPPTPPQGFL